LTIFERHKRAKEQGEGDLIFLPKDPDFLKVFLLRYSKIISSTSYTAIVLAGRIFWGLEWSKI